jgi:hypothetical protein
MLQQQPAQVCLSLTMLYQLLLCLHASLLCCCLLLQLWRISDLLYLPEDQVVAELEAHRCDAGCKIALCGDVMLLFGGSTQLRQGLDGLLWCIYLFVPCVFCLEVLAGRQLIIVYHLPNLHILYELLYPLEDEVVAGLETHRCTAATNACCLVE